MSVGMALNPNVELDDGHDGFEGISLPHELTSALVAVGYEKPTVIQTRILQMPKGHHVITGHAGDGKSTAVLIYMIKQVLKVSRNPLITAAKMCALYTCNSRCL